MSSTGNKSSGHLLAIGLALSLLAYWSGCPAGDVFQDITPKIERGQFEEALVELAALEERGRGGGKRVSYEAICLLALGEQPKAVKALQEGIEEHPLHHELSVILAEVYLSLGQSRLAVPVLLEARDRGAPDKVVSVTLAICHGHLRSFESALAELERAERSGAPATDVGYNRSLILLEEGRADEARDILEQVLEQSGEHLAALREHARALVLTAEGEEDERLVQAVTQVNQVLEIRTEDWRAYEILGDAFFAQADPMAAIAAYTEALRFGRNPAVVEDKYRAAAIEARRLYGDSVDLPTVKPEQALPPLPPSMEGLEHILRGGKG